MPLDTTKAVISLGTGSSVTTTNTTVAAAVTGYFVRLISADMFTKYDSADVYWASTGAVVLSGLMQLPARGGMVLPENESGWLDTPANTGLRLYGTCWQIGGCATFIYVANV